jgi:O-6-methylguanine DNA methyltransferase
VCGSKSRSGADTEFTRRVLAVVSRVPAGRVTTYGTVARLAGRPRAARAVGNILSQAPRAGLPYHRVIAANGLVGGYGGPGGLKRSLLAAEGLAVTGTRVLNFANVRWP